MVLFGGLVFLTVFLLGMALAASQGRRLGIPVRRDQPDVHVVPETGDALARRWLREGGRPLLLLALVAALLGAAVCYSVYPRWPALLGGLAAGFYAPRWWLARAARLRAEAFARALDPALGKVASHLRAGSNMEQALAAAAAEAAEPVRSELQAAVRAIELGATPAEALAQVAQRVGSRDLDLVVVAVTILSQTGGNLAEVLEGIGHQVHERRLTRQAVLAATTQVRVTAYVATALPFGLVLALKAINPNYFDPVLEHPGGHVLFLACFASVAFAWVLMRRTLSVEVD